jgi:hypothetical protein
LCRRDLAHRSHSPEIGHLEPDHYTLWQYFAVLLRWEEQIGPCCLLFTKDKMLSLDLQGHAEGTYRWTVRIAQGGRDGQLQILDRFLTAEGEELEFTWPAVGQ